jgi:hypothetical protein
MMIQRDLFVDDGAPSLLERSSIEGKEDHNKVHQLANALIESFEVLDE